MLPVAKKLAPSQVPFLKHVGFLEGTPCEIQAVTTSAPRGMKFVFVPEGGVPV